MQRLNLIRGHRQCRITRRGFPARCNELLGPATVRRGDDPLMRADLDDSLFATQAFQNDPDFL
jgi:hypothetical protein